MLPTGFSRGTPGVSGNKGIWPLFYFFGNMRRRTQTHIKFTGTGNTKNKEILLGNSRKILLETRKHAPPPQAPHRWEALNRLDHLDDHSRRTSDTCGLKIFIKVLSLTLYLLRLPEQSTSHLHHHQRLAYQGLV